MFELTDTQPDCRVPEVEYLRLLGFPRQHILVDRARELADWARAWFTQHGRPWVYARQTDRIEFADNFFRVNDTEFSSKLLREQFTTTQARHAVVIAVSAGRECEEQAHALWLDGKPDEYFFLEMFGSAVVEHLITTANGRICAWADSQGLAALPHHSPGYSGWNVSEQTKLWNVLRTGVASAWPGELAVMESGMLQPKKSLLALVGLASDRTSAAALARFVPCETCTLADCQFRRAPYKRARRPALS